MALQVYSSASRTSLPHNPALTAGENKRLRMVCAFAGADYSQLSLKRNWKERRLSSGLRTKASADVAAVVGQVTEVSKDTFWPIVEAAGDKIVVLDMYTQWCGPCKVIAPRFKELSEKYEDIVFLKLDCNQENKALAKELGIKVVPTFKILKDGKVVKEVTGAKFDNLVDAIESVRSSST